MKGSPGFNPGVGFRARTTRSSESGTRLCTVAAQGAATGQGDAWGTLAEVQGESVVASREE
jgi:hypothetical protein